LLGGRQFGGYAAPVRSPQVPGRRFALVSVLVTLLGAPVATAATPDEGLPNVDRRAARAADVPAARKAARAELRSDLGPLAQVRTAPESGGVSYVGRPTGTLTGPNAEDSTVTIALDYLRAHRDVFGLADADIAALRLVARAVSPDGITHLRFNQTLDGVASLDSGLDAHVTRDGRLITVSGAPVAGARLAGTDPSLDASAGRRAAREVSRGVDGPGSEPAVLRWAATADGPRLVWQVLTQGADGHGYEVSVDAASGALVRRQDLTAHLGEARYFAGDPDLTPIPTQLTMPPAWYDEHAGGTRLWGQFARTYVDPNDEDPAAGSEQGGSRVQIAASSGAPDWLFTQSHTFPGATPCPTSGCTWDSATPSSWTTNQFQAATNAHVLASRFHDHLVQSPIGFDEASGNFQRTNPSGNGLGGDYVRAEINDGVTKSPTPTFNNANFFTPPDGQAPRMQMFLFTSRDANGSDVADVVYHEYGHGLSSRLVVNASGGNTLSSQQPRMMGEAWSDFYAQDLVVAENLRTDTAAPAELTTGSYVSGPAGIRAKPIDCPVDPAGTTAACNGTFGAAVAGGYTYGDLAGTDNGTPHNGGEVWAQTLWDIRSVLGRNPALALITGGMRLSADNPSMVAMRDAILQQAVATRSAPGAPDDHYATLWQIFAARGFGAAASTPSADATNPVESFSAPVGLRSGATTISDPYPGGDADGSFEAGEQVAITQDVTGIGLTDLAGVTGTLAAPGLTVLDSTGAWPLLGRGRSAANGTPFTARLPAACTAKLPITIDVTSSEGTTQATAVIDPRTGSNSVVPLTDATPGGPGVATASFTVPAGATISDVDVRVDELRHSFLGDLRLEVLHDGETVVLVERFGNPNFSGDDLVDVIFDDEATSLPPNTGAGPISGRLLPATAGALAAFDGHPATGTWSLRVSDFIEQDSGTLRRWGLDSPDVACSPLEIPAASTGTASSVSTTSATVSGSGTPNGRATGLRFAYGTTAAYGASSPEQALGAGAAAVPGSAALTGLAPGTTYHYRAETIREGGVVAVSGEDRTFTTATPAPAVPTPTATPTPPAVARFTLRGLASRLTFDTRGRAFAVFTAPARARGTFTLSARLPRSGRRKGTQVVTLAKGTFTATAAGKVRARLALSTKIRKRLGRRTTLKGATFSAKVGTTTARKTLTLRFTRARRR